MPGRRVLCETDRTRQHHAAQSSNQNRNRAQAPASQSARSNIRRTWPLNARRLGEPGLHLVPSQASPVFQYDESRAGQCLVRPFVTIILNGMIVRVGKSGSPFPTGNVAENSSPYTGKFRRSPCPALPIPRPSSLASIHVQKLIAAQ